MANHEHDHVTSWRSINRSQLFLAVIYYSLSTPAIHDSESQLSSFKREAIEMSRLHPGNGWNLKEPDGLVVQMIFRISIFSDFYVKHVNFQGC